MPVDRSGSLQSSGTTTASSSDLCSRSRHGLWTNLGTCWPQSALNTRLRTWSPRTTTPLWRATTPQGHGALSVLSTRTRRPHTCLRCRMSPALVSGHVARLPHLHASAERQQRLLQPPRQVRGDFQTNSSTSLFPESSRTLGRGRVPHRRRLSFLARDDAAGSLWHASDRLAYGHRSTLRFSWTDVTRLELGTCGSTSTPSCAHRTPTTSFCDHHSQSVHGLSDHLEHRLTSGDLPNPRSRTSSSRSTTLLSGARPRRRTTQACLGPIYYCLRSTRLFSWTEDTHLVPRDTWLDSHTYTNPARDLECDW